jgi:hypothetical protein
MRRQQLVSKPVRDAVGLELMASSLTMVLAIKKVLQGGSLATRPRPRGHRQAPGLVMTVLRQSRLMLDEPHAGLSPAETNPMIDAIGAMMAAQISDTVGQDLEAGRLDFRLASAPGAEAHGGLLDGASIAGSWQS